MTVRKYEGLMRCFRFLLNLSCLILLLIKQEMQKEDPVAYPETFKILEHENIVPTHYLVFCH